MNLIKNKSLNYFWNIVIIGIIVFFLILCRNESYLLFHVFVELISIVIAFSLFTITWNLRKNIDNQFLILVGFAALFIAILDTFHTLTYQGMNIFKSNAFYANQVWIATRFIESCSLFFGLFLLYRGLNVRYKPLLILYSIITLSIFLSIFTFKVFPVCYIETSGQTNFKIYSEYVIISVFLISLYMLFKNKQRFETYVFPYIFYSIIFAIITELCFSLYVSNFGLANEIGHFSKFFGFYFIYKANIEMGLIKPNEIIYRNLKEREEKFKLLSEELSSLNSDYQKNNLMLQEANSTKDRFFSIISHDLKSPFNVLLGYCELLEKNALKYSPQRISQISSDLLKVTRQTYELLDNLLEWSRIQTGNLKPKSKVIPAYSIIREIVISVHPLFIAKNIKLEVVEKSNSDIYVDKEMLKTVLRNLITNALKFTHSGGIVIISLFDNNNTITYSVCDNGVGIEPENVQNIFNLDKNFTTKGTANEGGTGLGLILCKDFVEKNNGKIWVESVVNKGTTFFVTIPVYVRNSKNEN